MWTREGEFRDGDAQRAPRAAALVLMAGKAPYTVRGELPGSRDNYVHFIQEPFEPVRHRAALAKWEWTLPRA